MVACRRRLTRESALMSHGSWMLSTSSCKRSVGRSESDIVGLLVQGSVYYIYKPLSINP